MYLLSRGLRLAVNSAIHCGSTAGITEARNSQIGIP